MSGDLFEAVVEFPDSDARRRYEALIGLDEVQRRLVNEARILLDPAVLEEWSRTHHGTVIPAAAALLGRPPMFLFAGDVGTGKTALAESFGDAVARSWGRPVMLFRLSLSSRGSGAVGEMTQLLAAAFEEVRSTAGDGTPVVLLVDEADALAQSRENAQMHHEDRAGVNALIRGLNLLTEQRLPVIVVLATNRLESIDPAVRRRAAATFEFDRPNDAQRRAAFAALLAGSGCSDADLDALAVSTGPIDGRDWGYTFSDIYQRLVPTAVLRAFPSTPLSVEVMREVISVVEPTPPFRERR